MTNDAPFIDYALAVGLIGFVHFTAKHSWRQARARSSAGTRSGDASTPERPERLEDLV